VKRISLAATILALSLAAQANMTPKVIYGDDNRADVYEVDRSDLRELADSTVAMIPSAKMTERNSIFTLKTKNFGADYNLCQSGEPYYNQPTAAMCSGFLVGDDMIATAGHCINESTCGSNSFVFGFKMNSENQAVTEIPASEVYRCKQVLVHDLTNNQDYALVKLDRPVRGHRVLPLAKSVPAVGADIFVIGHPAGLPTKIAGGAKVRKHERGYFVANLDTYGGNSGSAVFDARDLSVVGILVRGEEDFEYSSEKQCRQSKRCEDGKCRGEDITNINYIADAIK